MRNRKNFALFGFVKSATPSYHVLWFDLAFLSITDDNSGLNSNLVSFCQDSFFCVLKNGVVIRSSVKPLVIGLLHP